MFGGGDHFHLTKYRQQQHLRKKKSLFISILNHLRFFFSLSHTLIYIGHDIFDELQLIKLSSFTVDLNYLPGSNEYNQVDNKHSLWGKIAHSSRLLNIIHYHHHHSLT